jgi:hypothetical protein
MPLACPAHAGERPARVWSAPRHTRARPGAGGDGGLLVHARTDCLEASQKRPGDAGGVRGRQRSLVVVVVVAV